MNMASFAGKSRADSETTVNPPRRNCCGNGCGTKKAVIEAHAKHEGDTGSPEVQVALLTARIEGLTNHFKIHKRIFIRAPACSEACRPSPQNPELFEKERYPALSRPYRETGLA